MNRVARLAGALLVQSGPELFLVGSTKVPCDWSAAGLARPTERDPSDEPIVRLEPSGGVVLAPPVITFGAGLAGETFARLVARRFLIERNGSVSERLWQLVIRGGDPDADGALGQELDAGWLGRPTLAVGQMANMGPAAWLEYQGDPAVFYSAAVGPALDTGVYILHAITGLFGPAWRVEAFGGIAIPRRSVLIPGREGQVVEVGAPDHLLIHLDFGQNRFAQVLSSFATPRGQSASTSTR